MTVMTNRTEIPSGLDKSRLNLAVETANPVIDGFINNR